MIKQNFYAIFINCFCLRLIFGGSNLYPSLCGLKFKNRIVGGSDSLPNAWPWTVSIQFNFKHICGGTLINNQWVLTAAHCFEFTTVSAYKVILGAHNITDSGIGTNAIRIGLSKIIPHQLFIGKFAYDIALLKLVKPVDYSMDILAACMPDLTDNFENQNCYFTGWGLTYSNGVTQTILREIMLPILSTSECIRYATSEIEQKYCSGKENLNQDTCQGDSGGGMLCLQNDKWHIAGIVSYGRGPCGNTVGINTRVDYFRNWIDETIKDN